MKERYQRQIIFHALGEAGQERLQAARVAVVGVGATGSTIANWLARAGVGYLRLIDRDFVELHNLQRQALYTEADVEEGLPKAIAAANALRRVNREITIEPVVADVNPENALDLLADVDLIMDGTDNFFTRYLINDVSLKEHIPWIYSGAIGAYGSSATFVPHEGPCYRCIFAEVPPPGTGDTCDTVGVLGPAVGVIASYAAGEALKLLARMGQRNPGLVYFDLLTNTWEIFHAEKRPNCPACGLGRYEFLEAEQGTWATSLCGREAVQIVVAGRHHLDLEKLAQRLQNAEDVRLTPYLLRFRVNGYEISVFPDARAIIKGTTDPDVAKSLYARYVGV